MLDAERRVQRDRLDRFAEDVEWFNEIEGASRTVNHHELSLAAALAVDCVSYMVGAAISGAGLHAAIMDAMVAVLATEDRYLLRANSRLCGDTAMRVVTQSWQPRPG